MTPMMLFTNNSVETVTAPADFGVLIRSIQYLNKNALPHYRAAKDYSANVRDFFEKLKTHKEEYARLLVEDLGYSTKAAEIDLTETFRYMEIFPESTQYRPAHIIPEGLIAVFGTWSSPLYRFVANVLPSLLNEGSVLLFCEPEVSRIYCKLAEHLSGSSLSEHRLVVLPITDKDTLDTLLEHPSIHGIQGQTQLYSSALFRNRVLSAEKNYSLHFGAHNPVIILNDASETAVTDLLYPSLQFHIRSEIRFNRWFVQEKIFPDVLKWISTTIEKWTASHANSGEMKVASYRSAFASQAAEIKTSKHWLVPGVFESFNVCTDFSNCSPLHQTELLGPLLTLTRFKNGPEATKFAGTTHYANATTIVTSNTDKYTELAQLQRTPFVYHNRVPSYFDSSLLSGNGYCALATCEYAHSQKRTILY